MHYTYNFICILQLYFYKKYISTEFIESFRNIFQWIWHNIWYKVVVNAKQISPVKNRESSK